MPYKMNLGEFLPFYPPEASKGFSREIFRKKEFRDLFDHALIGGFHRHQVFAARFLSFATPYRSLLLLHEMGTGKSGAAAAVFEELRRMKPGLRTLYVSNNDSLLNNFKKEVFRLASSLYDPAVERAENPVYARNRILARAGFTFTTYYRLAQQLRHPGERNLLEQRFRNDLVILDEVHHLVVNELDGEVKKAEEPAYAVIARFLDKLENRRLLLLTGTPMRDSSEEIVKLLNLVLPAEKRLTDLTKYVVAEDGGKRLRWREGREEAFIRRIRGYVSFYRQRSVPKVYEGELIPPMRYYRLARHVMEDHQTRGYEKAYRQDCRGKGRSFFAYCQQASLFVFPDGSFHRPENENNPYFSRRGKKREFTTRFERETGLQAGLTTEEKLAIVRRLSVTYHDVIRSILRHPKEKMYVYCDKIYNSGILVCIHLLCQFFGFQFLTASDTGLTPRRRCVLLHETAEEETVSKSTLDRLKDRFNQDDNIHGEYIQVIFGTDKTREGISLRHIRRVHVCAGDWNFGKIFQAIGRGIRLGSHQGLPAETVVRISLHCAMPRRSVGVMTEPDEELPPILASSIDFVRYFRAERKDFNIKLVEHALMVGAVDCPLHRTVNTIMDGIDGSAECMYRSCRYRCAEELDEEVDVSSFNTFYATRPATIDHTVDRVRGHFYNRTLATFSGLRLAFPEMTAYQLHSALAMLTDHPLTIGFWDERRLYLHRSNDVLYASEERSVGAPARPAAWRAVFAQKPSFVRKTPFSVVLGDLRLRNFSVLCSRLSSHQQAGLVRAATEVFEAFPPAYQEAFLAVLAQNPDGSGLTRWLLTDVFSDVLFQRNDRWVWRRQPQKLFTLGTGGTWVHAPRSVDSRYEDHEAPAFVERYVRNRVCYGYVDPKDDKFRIRDVSGADAFTNKKDATKGKVCKSFDFYHLLFFLYVVAPQCDPENAEEERILGRLLALSPARLQERASEVVPGLEPFLALVAKHDGDLVEATRFAVFQNERFHNKKTALCERLQRCFREAGLMVRPPLVREMS